MPRALEEATESHLAPREPSQALPNLPLRAQIHEPLASLKRSDGLADSDISIILKRLD